MRAMILAAGRGERLRPLTDQVPKPLVEAGGKALIVYHLEALAKAGFEGVVINTGHLGQQLPTALGKGERWNLDIHYSAEPPDALETGGGIFRALPLLGNEPFAVINGDIWTDYPLASLRDIDCSTAHLVMVPNPAHNPAGDFSLQQGRIHNQGPDMLTFSGISLYHPRLFEGCTPGRWSIVPLLRQAVDHHFVSGELHGGSWYDSGTPERLAELRVEVGRKNF